MANEEPLYIGWCRSGFFNWEPVTLPAGELVEVAKRLYLHIPFDPEDGEKVVLPETMEPVAKRNHQ